MADTMEENGRTMEIEPTAEGPKVKAKRVLTEAQLEALKLGRSKLAEKRRMIAATVEETTAEVKKEVGPEEPEIGWAISTKVEPAKSNLVKEESSKGETIDDSYQLCSIM